MNTLWRDKQRKSLMFRIIVVYAFSLFIIGCNNNQPIANSPTQTPVIFPSETASPTKETPSPTIEIIVSEPSASTLTPSCNPSIEIISTDFVYFNKWTNHLILYSTDRDLATWKTYPDNEDTLELLDVLPILTPAVKEIIHFNDTDIPYYSISPSGKRLIFWEDKYTRPTPTATSGLGGTSGSDLLDIYVITEDSNQPRLITQIEGWISEIYWSTDENVVYIAPTLPILQRNNILRLDLVNNTSEIIINSLPDRDIINISLSPDENIISYRVVPINENVNTYSLVTGETVIYKLEPYYDQLFWIDQNHWLLVESTQGSTNFMIIDYQKNQIETIFEYDKRVELQSTRGSLNQFNIPGEGIFAFHTQADYMMIDSTISSDFELILLDICP